MSSRDSILQIGFMVFPGIKWMCINTSSVILENVGIDSTNYIRNVPLISDAFNFTQPHSDKKTLN